MNKAYAVNRAAAAGLVAMLPHPQHRAYLRVCREVCGCIFERHVQHPRLEEAGRCCPKCGDTSPSPPVPAPILLAAPKEHKPHAHTSEHVPTRAELHANFLKLAQTMQDAVEGIYAELDALKQHHNP